MNQSVKHLLRGWFCMGCVMVLMAVISALTDSRSGDMPKAPSEHVTPHNCSASGVCQ